MTNIISKPPITLVTGPTGNTGREIVKKFQQLGNVPFTVMTHNEKRHQDFLRQGIESRLGNYDNRGSLRDALKGIKSAYFVCTPDERLVHRGANFFFAAEEVGVKHVTYLSAHLADPDSESQNLQFHGVLEEVLKNLAFKNPNFDYTIIQPHGFFQTWMLFSRKMIEGAGVISFPGGDGEMAFVDVRNVAEVGIKVLLNPEQHKGQTYVITGLVAMNHYEHAEVLSKVLGKNVIYIPSTESQFELIARAYGFEGSSAQHVKTIFGWQRGHRLGKRDIHPTLKDLDIPFITYEQFLHDWIAGRTGGGNSFDESESLRVKALNGLFNYAMYARHKFIDFSDYFRTR